MIQLIKSGFATQPFIYIYPSFLAKFPGIHSPRPGRSTTPDFGSMYLLNELWGRWRVVAETFFMPKPTFSTDQIPDLSGQVFIVTGVKYNHYQ